MPVWLPPTAAEQPHVSLVAWGAFEVLVPELGTPTIHVAGIEEGIAIGRVSSPVAKVDAKNRCVETSTGRIYRLIGTPGLQGDAVYVWRRWVANWSANVLSNAAPALLHAFEAEESSDGCDAA